MTTNREESIPTTIHDVSFFLKASQTHLNPTHPEVAELATQELHEATKLIANNLLYLHLVVGDEPVEAVEPHSNNPSKTKEVAIAPGAEVMFVGAEKGTILATHEDKALRIQPQAIARTLINGGKLFVPKLAELEDEDGFYGEAEVDEETEHETAEVEAATVPDQKVDPLVQPTKAPVTQAQAKPTPRAEAESETEVEAQTPIPKKNVEQVDLIQPPTQPDKRASIAGHETNANVKDPLPLEWETPHYYAFEDLTSPQQYLGYEHVRDFQTKHQEELSVRMTHSIFSALVMPRKALPTRGNMGPRIDPSTLGLVVCTRDEVGFPKLPQRLSLDKDKEIVERVVQVGSVINYVRLLQDPSFRKDQNVEGMLKLEYARPRLVTFLAQALQVQVNDPPLT
jgi:hypothetical protein